MKISMRGWIIVGTFAVIVAVIALTGTPVLSQAAPRTGGQLSERSLGDALVSLGLKVKKEKQRYDFAYTAKHDGREWELSMSALLSNDGQSIWIMAWLDELPKTSKDVPITALLRLLALNDRLGNGMFFSFIVGNRRLVLQRVLDNRNLTSSTLRDALRILGSSVMDTHTIWSVANWKNGAPAAAGSGGHRGPAQTGARDSRFPSRRRN